ncbi:MAG: YfhO family protein [Lachnospiraceae bacterium]|nr:YfhO family protein [Lachnospiraceae bacterium]
MSGLKRFPGKADRLHSHIAAFLIVFIAMTVFCALSRITPFGDNTFLYDDLRREYIRYYAYLSSVLRGEASIFYFSGKSLGGSVLGLLMIYASSPLNLLYALFPPEQYPEVLTFLMILRLSLLSFTSDLFLREIGLKYTLPFSVSCGMSLWAFSFLVNPLWVDAVIFFPVFMAAALRLSENPYSGKAFVCFSLATAFQLYLNYYLSYMMLLFLAALMIIRTGLKKISIRGLVSAFLSAVSGILLMMPLLFPVLKELLESEKNLGDTPVHETLSGGSAFTEPLLVLSKLFTFAIDSDQIMFGMPHLFCGTVMIPLFILFFVKKDIPRKDKLETMLLVLLIFAAFCLRPLDLIWHVGNTPNGFPYRYAFLFVSLMMISAARAWNSGLPSVRELTVSFIAAAILNIAVLLRFAAAPGMPWYSPFKGAAGLAVLAIEYILIRIRLRDPDRVSVGSTGLSGAACDRDASPSAGNMLLSGTSCDREIPHFPRNALLSGAACGLLFLMCIAELSMNQRGIMTASRLPSEKASEYRTQYLTKKALTDRIKSQDDGFYRLEDTYSDTYDSLDDSMAFGYRGVSHYSTGDHISVRLFLRALGFNYNGLNNVYTAENTDTCDSVLNIRYLLTPEGIYENKNAFPSAVSTDADIPSDMITDSPFELQEKMAMLFSKDAAGKGSEEAQGSLNEGRTEGDADNSGAEFRQGPEPGLFMPVSVTSDEIRDGGENALIRQLQFRTEAEGNLYLYIKGLQDKTQDMNISLNGEHVSGYANLSALKILDLGHHERDREGLLELTLYGDKEAADFGDPVMVTENLRALERLSKGSREDALNVRELSPTTLLIEDCPAGKVFLSVPYEEGFRASIGNTGEKCSVSPAFGALTQIDSKNAGDIILTYHVPGSVTGSLMAAAGLLLMLFCFFRSHVRGGHVKP